MDQLRIRGGRRLAGEIVISGAKNAALPEMCAALLTAERVHLQNVPSLNDVTTMARLLKTLGAEIAVEHGYIVARAARLQGTRITTDMITVTGTENLLMAATLAEGETVLGNAAQEPEIPDLAEMLIAMGARIEGHGTSRIRIEGVRELHGVSHRTIPDRIEAGTFL